MLKYMRWTAVLAVLLLVLAACQSGGGGASAGASGDAEESEAAESQPAESGAAGGGDPETVCAEDEFGCVEIAEGDPLELGTALVITGENESLGLDVQYGVEAAKSLRPEIAGHEVEFNHQDDGCSTEGGTAAANALASEESIVAVIGTSCSSAAIPASEILSGEGILLISASNTAPSLTAEDSHQPFYARTAHNDSIQGAAMAQFVCEELGLSTAATIDDGSAYADQLAAVFAEEFQSQCDGTITAEEAVTVGQSDMGPVLESIGTDSPEFLYFPVFTAEGALIARDANQATGLENTVLGGADGIFSQDFLDAAGDATEGMYLSGPDLEFSGDFYEAEFLPAYSEVSGEDEPIQVFHAHGYDAYNMLADAIEEVAIQGDDGTTYIPRTALRDAFFATSEHEGITGSLTCNETGDCADARISVSQVTDGEFVRIWPEE
jgi:branched-chain amino acid transport system substrate-binding protein